MSSACSMPRAFMRMISWICPDALRTLTISCPFFFFQAEDGIRDGHVTGVQTCALPILRAHAPAQGVGERLRERDRVALDGRSEERRVGKEWRSALSPGDERTNAPAGLREPSRGSRSRPGKRPLRGGPGV